MVKAGAGIHENWRYGQDGPGGASVPYNVMSTGSLAPFNPRYVRRDISETNVAARTAVPVARMPGVAAFTPAQRGQPMPVQAQSPSAPELNGVVLGADRAGRPVRQYAMPFSMSVPQARQAVGAFKRIAKIMRQQNLFNLAPPLVGGPPAALARGEAVVLRWPNGIALTAAL